MKVIVEEVTEKDYPSPKKNKRKKRAEICLYSLWDDPDMVFKPEDDIPPEKWDYQIYKVKY